jgi:hypothetical protein
MSPPVNLDLDASTCQHGDQQIAKSVVLGSTPTRRKFSANSAINSNCNKYSLNNLNRILQCHMQQNHGSTLSLDEQYLIDEIEKTPVVSVTLNHQTSCSIKTLNNLNIDDEGDAHLNAERSNSIGSVDSIANDAALKHLDLGVVSPHKPTHIKNKPSVLSYSSSLSSTKSTHSSSSLSISPSPSSSNNSDRTNSSVSNHHILMTNSNGVVVSTEDDVASCSGGVNNSSQIIDSGVIFRNANILLNDLLIDDDDDDAEIEAEFARHNLDSEDRRETLIFKQMRPTRAAPEKEATESQDIVENIDCLDSTNAVQKSTSTSSSLNVYASNKKAASSTLSSSHSFNMACEVASLTSVYSNYSQFDFVNNNNSNTHLSRTNSLQQQHLQLNSNRASPSPPPVQEPATPVTTATTKQNVPSDVANLKKPLNSTPSSTTMTTSQSNSSSLSSFLG